jgi:membrane protein DedA with SNARE-associated domain
VFVAGVLGNVAGSYIAWAVGKYAGQAAIARWGRRVGIREHEIDKATVWFERHGPVAVLVGRVIPVIRTFISLPAGFAGMRAGIFGVYTTLGVIPWTAALTVAGYALGANWEHVANDFHGPTYAIAGIVVVGVVVLFIRRRKAAAAAAAESVPASARPGPAAARPGMPGPAAAQAPGSPAGQRPPMEAPRPGPYAPQGRWAQHQADPDQDDWDYQPDPAGRYR